ncbi:MAG: glycosyltransferase [Bacteroidaceae bacterium]|nr:glycosyltransferase [Bacteroidaceae bacterium]
MRILFVNNIPFNPILGGIGRVTDILTKGLIAKGGYEVYYLCGKVELQNKYQLNYDYPVPLYTLPESVFKDSGINKEFYQHLLEKLEIDVVVNQRGLGSGFDKMMEIGNIKKVCVLHTKPNAKINHDLSRMLLFSKTFKEQIKKYIKVLLYPYFYSRTKYMAKQYLKKTYRELVRCSDAIILLSDNDKKEFLSNGINLGDKILCGIPNPNTFPAVNNISIEKKENIILYVGRLDPFDKNVIALIKIWERLYKMHPTWKLVLVGDGADRNRIEEYVNERCIKNVYLDGARDNVADYYSKASFICLTSNFEGWGMALTEGMQYGCIPFTFNNYGAASDIIDDGINGCLIPAYDLKKYVFRLSELMLDADRRIKMSKAAIEKVKKFSVENVVDKWDKLFQSI